ncbi:MAG: hypothetical protein ABI330_22085 [Caldimonas sp.]
MQPAFPGSRNPFGVADAPDPDAKDVEEFAAGVDLCGLDDDPNAPAWSGAPTGERHEPLQGTWSSRWNGGADPSIASDTPERWKAGTARLETVGERVFILFDWSDGARQALVDARRDGPNTLRGRYVNLGDLSITRPWVGLIVDPRRIEGCWSHGRLDFRR